ncbi:hypothetical protein EDB89DRAFT_1969430, partial [Lactarius sanguifluus]
VTWCMRANHDNAVFLFFFFFFLNNGAAFCGVTEVRQGSFRLGRREELYAVAPSHIKVISSERRLSHQHTAPPLVTSPSCGSCLQHVGLSKKEV